MSGKRERPGHFQIDQKTLEYKQVPDEIGETDRDKPQKIKQRKFYKIKVPGQGEHEGSSSKPKFTLFNNDQNHGEHKNDHESLHQQKNENKESVQNKQDSSAKKQIQLAEKEAQKPKNIFPVSSPFFNGTGLFSNGIGIFTNNEKGIFSNNTIFPKKDSTPSGPDNKTNQPKSLNPFGTSQSIFSFAKNGPPPIKKQARGEKDDDGGENEDEDDGKAEQLQRDQNKQIDPTKSTGKYQYSSECEILFQKTLVKFKKGDGDVVQNSEVIVQQNGEKNTNWIVVRLVATKNPILTGLLIKGKSEVKKMGSKQQNVTLSVMQVKDKNHERCVVKLQFQKPEEGRGFTELIEKLIK